MWVCRTIASSPRGREPARRGVATAPPRPPPSRRSHPPAGRRSPARARQPAHARHTATKSSARSRSAWPRGRSAKSDSGDRRGEPPVEALGEAQPGVHAVPAGSAARARARAAGGRGRGRTAPPRRSGRGRAARTRAARYSCTCHGLSERGGPFGARVSTLGRGQVHHAAVAHQPRGSARAPTPGSCRCSIVCRNTTASAGAEKRFDQVALEAQVGAAGSARGRVRAPRGLASTPTTLAADPASTSEP